jgi:hypothetical protein
MSARSGITKAIADKLAKELNGTGFYINNVYGNVDTKVVTLDGVKEFPYISVTPGPEIRQDMPSNVSISTLKVYIRIYVENNNDPQAELESIISDVENFIDTHLNLEYNINTVAGVEKKTTIDNTIVSISTDEGLLAPNGLGEIILDVRYEKIRKF